MQKYWTFALLLFTTLLSAQTGRISGTILDSKTGETLPGATVLVEGTAKGASADFDGKFAINNVPAGKVTLVVSYISYTSKKIASVNVVANDITDVNIQLDPSTSKDLVEVEVVVTLNKENNTALVLQQKNNISVSDGISAETIKRTPDKNTSDVLKRVSGASIQDNKFAIVRGLNERYNAAYLNGAPLPSSESDRKAFAFDIFPSNMLDNLVITKTARADMPGEFAGGIIDISTKNIPEKNFFSFSASAGYNTITTGKEQIYYKGGKLDWLGIDDGSRKMPEMIPSFPDYPVSTKDKAALAKSVPETNWKSESKTYAPNSSYQMATGYNFKRKEKDFFGVLASLSYNRTNSFFAAERNSFSDNADVSRASQLDAVYKDKNYTSQVLAGGLLNLSVKLNENNSISSKNLYSINSDDRTIKRDGNGALTEPNQTLSKTTAFAFTSNKILSDQLIGEHFIPKIKMKINWVGSYSGVKRDVPNYRRNSYGKNKDLTTPGDPNPYDTTFTAILSPSSVGNDYGGFMFWSNLNEDIKSVKLDVSKPYKASPNLNFDFKIGSMGQQRARNFYSRQFGFTFYTPVGGYFSDSLLRLPEDQIFTNQNMGVIAPGVGGFKLTEGTTPRTSYYKASSVLKAAYAQADIKYRSWFRAAIGARLESYYQKLVFPDELFVITQGETTLDTTVTDILPSANFVFSLNDKQNIRVSYSQTLNRPEFREIAPFAFYDFTTLFLTTGNPSLKRAKITNYDLRYEIYPGRGQLFSVSSFFKSFENPIEQKALKNPNEISYENAPKGSCYGLEMEYRIILGTFMKNDSNRIGKFLNNLTLFTNVAIIKSVVDISYLDKTENTPNQRQLQGQSPYLINAGLSYVDNEKGYSASAIINRIGQRINVVGNYGVTPTIWESGRTVFDLQASKSFLKNKLELRFTARDIFAKWQPQYFYNKKGDEGSGKFEKKKDDIIRKINYGTTYALQLTLKF